MVALQTIIRGFHRRALLFDRMPSSFDQGIVRRSTFSIQTSPNVKTANRIGLFLRGQRTALIGMESEDNHRVPPPCITSPNTNTQAGMGKMKSDHKTTTHIDDGTEVKPTASYIDISGPNMIQLLNRSFSTIITKIYDAQGFGFFEWSLFWGQEYGYGATGRYGRCV